MHGDVLGEVLEIVGAGDEVGFAIGLDQHPQAAARVDVGSDQPLAGVAPGALLDRRHAFLAQQLDRLLHVAVGLGQRLLAIHHPQAGGGPEVLHHLSGYCSHNALLASLD